MGPVTLRSLHHLKEATKDLHRTLDRESGMVRLMSADLGIAEYAQVLEKMLCIHAFIEPVLLQAEKTLGRVACWQPKADWLISDLRQLQPDIVFPFASLHALPNLYIHSLAELAGCLYVLEGATLGGQVILKRLRHTLGPEVETAVRFFQAYGDNTLARWGATCQGIDKHLQHEDDLVDACRKAREVFGVFITVMRQAVTSPLEAASRIEA